MPSPPPSRLCAAMHALLTVGLLWLFIRFPGQSAEFDLRHFLRWPVELPLLIAVMVLPPPRWRAAATGVVAMALGLLVALRFADLGARAAFGRAFSPLADLHLFGQGWTLASQSIGRLEAAAVVAIFGVLLVGMVLWLWRASLLTGRLIALRSRGRSVAGVLSLALVAGVALNAAQAQTGRPLGVKADLVDDWRNRLDRTRAAIADQRAFVEQLAADPIDMQALPTFSALGGRDVVILFVESYGRSYLDHARFRPSATRALARLEETVIASGLSMRSAWADSPIRGGRSWLAQATVQSGLMLYNQARFDRLLASGRCPLAAKFEAAGYSSAAILPVVSGAWHEGAWYDVDRFFDGPALDFRGERLGYVTMPDQYTLHAFERDVRSTVAQPLFATVGLLGSHAPWTPLVDPVSWDDLAHGQIFDGSHRHGETLDWARPDAVRDAYARSLELTLGTVGDYLQRFADDALFIVVGDHQPASVIAGWAPNAHVPLHVITRDAALLERLPDELFGSGARPDATAPALPLADVRTLLAERFERAP